MDLSSNLSGEAGPRFFSTVPVEKVAGLPYNHKILLRFVLSLPRSPPDRPFSVRNLIPLTSLQPGQVAEVYQIVGQAEQVRRLEELGLRGGMSLEMVRSGSPCIVRLEGSTLCFRDVESLQVLVLPRMTA